MSASSLTLTLREDFGALIKEHAQGVSQVSGLELAEFKQLNDRMADLSTAFAAAIGSAVADLPDGRTMLAKEYEALSKIADKLGLPEQRLLSKVQFAGLNVENINLAYLGIRDVEYLRCLDICPELKCLYLANNRIEDLEPLAGLSTLQGLYIHHNQVTDITPLANLASLTELYLYSNPISDLTPLHALANLNHLWLDGVAALSDESQTWLNRFQAHGGIVDLHS